MPIPYRNGNIMKESLYLNESQTAAGKFHEIPQIYKKKTPNEPIAVDGESDVCQVGHVVRLAIIKCFQ